MSVFLSSFGFGLISAAVLAIATVGFTMQFAVTNVLNLAYGSVMINSAFVTYYLNVHARLNAWVAMLGGMSDWLRRVLPVQSLRLHAVPATQPRCPSRSSSWRWAST